MSKDGIARAAQALAPRVAKSFLKQTEYIHSMFDVGRSMFEVQQFLLRSDWPLFRQAAPLVRRGFYLLNHIRCCVALRHNRSMHQKHNTYRHFYRMIFDRIGNFFAARDQQRCRRI